MVRQTISRCRSVDHYRKLDKIEEGSYGVVYRAQDVHTGEIVALKRLKLGRKQNGFPITALREIVILTQIQHPNIVRVREVVMGKEFRNVFIVMDFVEQDLASVLDKRNAPFSVSAVKGLMKQLLSAISVMHGKWVIHRDLKPSNLLFSKEGQIKVADFGLARKFPGKLSPVVVTLWYRAPELLLGSKEYSTAVDMWSIGCIMGELLTNRPLFPGTSEIDQLYRIFRMLGTPTETNWPEFDKLPNARLVTFVAQDGMLGSIARGISSQGLDLLSGLLSLDPKQRINAEDALNHEWLREYPHPSDLISKHNN